MIPLASYPTRNHAPRIGCQDGWAEFTSDSQWDWTTARVRLEPLGPRNLVFVTEQCGTCGTCLKMGDPENHRI